MLTLAFLRHGQTACSVRGCYCGGGCDAALNDNGLRMAAVLGSALSAKKWSAIVSSPQQRARQTVAPLAEHLGVEIEIQDGLRELEYGAWDGRTPDELSQEPSYRAWLEDPATHAPPGGESALQVATRAQMAVGHIRDRCRDGHVLVASHKTTIRVLLCGLLGINPRYYRARLAQPLGGLSSVTFATTGPRLDSLADLSHLPAELRGIAGS